MSDANTRYADSVGQLFRQWTGRLATVIHAGQKAGRFRADISAESLAQVIVSTVEGGGIMMSRLQKEEDPLKACLDGLKTFLWTTAQ